MAGGCARYPRVIIAFILPLGSVNCRNVVYSLSHRHIRSIPPLPFSQVVFIIICMYILVVTATSTVTTNLKLLKYIYRPPLLLPSRTTSIIWSQDFRQLRKKVKRLMSGYFLHTLRTWHRRSNKTTVLSIIT